MQLAKKQEAVALHLARVDMSGYWCRGRTEATLCTWVPEDATCKKCLAAHRKHVAAEAKRRNQFMRRNESHSLN